MVASQDIPSGTFIIEYVGEVLGTDQFQKRAANSDARHFYFMSLKSDLIIDASKKGNISRFMNHSCNPNCETQKWLVGGKIRIGLFSKKPIKAGTELTFDYKFERFGYCVIEIGMFSNLQFINERSKSKPQACYCGESNCKGTIGIVRKKESEGDSDNDTDDSTSPSSLICSEEEDEVAETIKKKKRNPSKIEDEETLLVFVKTLVLERNVKKIQKYLKMLLDTDSVAILKRFIIFHAVAIIKSFLESYKHDKNITELV